MPRWLSWLNTSVSKTIPSKYINKHTIYQACKDKTSNSMQDIKETKRERVSNHKHKKFVSRFEHTCSTSPPSTHEGFPLCTIPMISPWYRNTYNPSDSLLPYTRKPYKLAEAAPQTKSSQSNSKPPRAHLPVSSKYKNEISW